MGFWGFGVLGPSTTRSPTPAAIVVPRRLWSSDAPAVPSVTSVNRSKPRGSSGITPAAPDLVQQVAILREHVVNLHEFYGAFMGVRIARKHVGWYLQNRADARVLRSAFNTLESASAQTTFIDQLMIESTDHKELAA